MELAKDENWIKSNLPLQEKRVIEAETTIPLSQSYVRKAHRQRLKEIRIINLSLDVVLSLFSALFAMLIAYGHRSPNAYYLGAAIKNMMITNKFDKVNCYSLIPHNPMLQRVSITIVHVFNNLWAHARGREVLRKLANLIKYNLLCNLT